MALIGNDLGDAMAAAVAEADEKDRQAMFRAMGVAIVNYFKTNTDVTIDDPSGLADTAGNPPSSSHTGTATGSIS